MGMKGHTVILRGPHQRALATRLVMNAPDGFVVSIAEQTRTGEQNSLLWSILSEISRAKPMGRHHTPDDWKAIFMNACGWECQFVEGLDGRPFPQGFRSSKLTKGQMTNLIEYMLAFCAEHRIHTILQGEAA